MVRILARGRVAREWLVLVLPTLKFARHATLNIAGCRHGRMLDLWICNFMYVFLVICAFHDFMYCAYIKHKSDQLETLSSRTARSNAHVKRYIKFVNLHIMIERRTTSAGTPNRINEIKL